MSDLYLILRRRLEDVTDWVELGTPTLKNARKARGLSYEAMGREMNVAAKTWERYEKRGRVPRHLLPQVAEVLELEIDWPKRTTVTIAEPPNGASQIAQLEDVLRETRLTREALQDLAAAVARFESLVRGNEGAAQSG